MPERIQHLRKADAQLQKMRDMVSHRFYIVFDHLSQGSAGLHHEYSLEDEDEGYENEEPYDGERVGFHPTAHIHAYRRDQMRVYEVVVHGIFDALDKLSYSELYRGLRHLPDPVHRFIAREAVQYTVDDLLTNVIHDFRCLDEVIGP